VPRLRALFGWHDGVPGEQPAHPRVAARLAVVALAVLLVLPQLRAIAGPYEDWPFSSAPMFATYHDPEWPVFELTFHAAFESGRERALDPRTDLGIGEIAFKRQLFGDYYGSIDPRHPAGHHPDDTPELFRQRLGDLCRKLAVVLRQRSGAAPRSIRLELSRLQQSRDARGAVTGSTVTARRTVFAFDVATDRPIAASPP
jgi:hypothetical protein